MTKENLIKKLDSIKESIIDNHIECLSDCISDEFILNQDSFVDRVSQFFDIDKDTVEEYKHEIFNALYYCRTWQTKDIKIYNHYQSSDSLFSFSIDELYLDTLSKKDYPRVKAWINRYTDYFVNDDDDIYYCCSGDVVNFLMDIDDKPYILELIEGYE